MKTKTFRPLTSQEIEQLQLLGNRAEDWSLVQVDNTLDVNLIRNNVFMGRVSLARLCP